MNGVYFVSPLDKHILVRWGRLLILGNLETS